MQEVLWWSCLALHMQLLASCVMLQLNCQQLSAQLPQTVGPKQHCLYLTVLQLCCSTHV